MTALRVYAGICAALFAAGVFMEKDDSPAPFLCAVITAIGIWLAVFGRIVP